MTYRCTQLKLQCYLLCVMEISRTFTIYNRQWFASVHLTLHPTEQVEERCRCVRQATHGPSVYGLRITTVMLADSTTLAIHTYAKIWRLTYNPAKI